MKPIRHATLAGIFLAASAIADQQGAVPVDCTASPEARI